jgi:hypothetical protein
MRDWVDWSVIATGRNWMQPLAGRSESESFEIVRLLVFGEISPVQLKNNWPIHGLSEKA